MTTYIPFQPQQSTTPPFQATVTLDGGTYNLLPWWNLYTGWWFLTIKDQTQTPVWSGYMAASPPDSDIYLAPGIFSASTILYRDSTGNFEITP